ncbi:MAG: hypothetical protein DMF61_02325 [Blastocatellia bacterium AA13]|nr:MAG: hypothetical protein DMF61_02325 [Blastocatellia bacterium AA13]
MSTLNERYSFAFISSRIKVNVPVYFDAGREFGGVDQTLVLFKSIRLRGRLNHHDISPFCRYIIQRYRLSYYTPMMSKALFDNEDRRLLSGALIKLSRR